VSIDTAVQPCEDRKVGGMVTGVQSVHPSVGAPFRVVGQLLFMGGWSEHSSLLVGSCHCLCPFCVVICGCEGWAPLIYHGQ
jgi:hypothetical protein